MSKPDQKKKSHHNRFEGVTVQAAHKLFDNIVSQRLNSTHIPDCDSTLPHLVRWDNPFSVITVQSLSGVFC